MVSVSYSEVESIFNTLDEGSLALFSYSLIHSNEFIGKGLESGMHTGPKRCAGRAHAVLVDQPFSLLQKSCEVLCNVTKNRCTSRMSRAFPLVPAPAGAGESGTGAGEGQKDGLGQGESCIGDEELSGSHIHFYSKLMSMHRDKLSMMLARKRFSVEICSSVLARQHQM